jgi:hypothetical protein
LENSCHARGNRSHALRCRDSLAQQKVRYASITGDRTEFRCGERARNSLYRRSHKPIGGKLGINKPANFVINRFPFEFRAIARIL